MSNQNYSLRTENLSIGYGTKVICNNIELTLPKGELCAVIGVNGIGKSTLIRTLGKLQPSLGGEAFINGHKIAELKPHGLAKTISLVLTEQPASKNLRVSELIALGRQPYTNWIGKLTDEDKRHIQQNLDAFLLKDLAMRKCHELSDGQLQRVLIARAAAQDTPIILLDEPTTHLDLYHKVQILKMLRQLAHEKGKTIVFSTHEIDLAIQLCDKILILNGTKNPFGTPQDLIGQKQFDNLFPENLLEFDERTGGFKVKK